MTSEKVISKPIRSMGRPKGITREERNQEILLAARKCFAEKGYDGTSFNDVGKIVGVSHAALYKYYPSKVELYAATLEHAQEAMLPFYIEALNGKDTIKEKLKALLMASASRHGSHPNFTGFLGSVPIEIQRHPELKEAVMERSSGIMDVISDVFEEARASGEIDFEGSSESFFIAFMGAAMGIGILSFGLGVESMKPSIEIFNSVLDGSFF